MKQTQTFTFRITPIERNVMTQLSDVFGCSEAQLIRQLLRIAGIETHLLTPEQVAVLEPTPKPGRPVRPFQINQEGQKP
jgi:hypothetical protein